MPFTTLRKTKSNVNFNVAEPIIFQSNDGDEGEDENDFENISNLLSGENEEAEACFSGNNNTQLNSPVSSTAPPEQKKGDFHLC